MPTISIKVPDDLDARLEARARTLRRSKSDLTREALSRYLDDATTTDASRLDLVRDLVRTVCGPGDLASSKEHMRGYGQ